MDNLIPINIPGVGIVNFPGSMSQDQIKLAAGKLASKAKQNQQTSQGLELAPGVPIPGMPQAPTPPGMDRQTQPAPELGQVQGTVRAFGQGLTAGQMAPMTGAASLVNPFDEGSPTGDTLFGGNLQRWAAERYLRNKNQYLEQEEKFAEDNPWLQAAGELGGAIALTALTEGLGSRIAATRPVAAAMKLKPVAEATKFLSTAKDQPGVVGAIAKVLASKPITGAATGAGYGAASGFGRSTGVTPGEIGSDVESGALLGGITGGVLSPVIQSLGNVVSKYKNRVGVQLPEEVLSEAQQSSSGVLSEAEQRAKSIVDSAAEMADQAKAKAANAVSQAEGKLEASKQLGKKVEQRENRRLAFMAADAERQTAQAKDLVGKAKDELHSGIYTTLSDLENTEAQGWQSAGNRADDALTASLRKANEETRSVSNDLYQKVSDLAEGEESFPLVNFSQALKGTSEILPDSPADKLIKSIRNRIVQGTEEEGNKTLRKFGFQEVQKAITELESIISSGFAGEHGAISTRDVARLQTIKKALERDARTFLENRPALQDAVDAASEYYKTNRVPFMERDISSAFQQTDPDQVFKALMGKGKDQAKRVLSILTPEGASAMRGKILQGIRENSIDESSGVLDPKKLLKQLDANKDQLEVYFSGASEGLDQLKMLARETQKAEGAISEVALPKTTPRIGRAEEIVETRETQKAQAEKTLKSVKEKASQTEQAAQKTSQDITSAAKQKAEDIKSTAQQRAEELKQKLAKRKAQARILAGTLGTGAGYSTPYGVLGSLAGLNLGAIGSTGISNLPAVERFLLSESNYNQGALAKALRRYASGRVAKEYVTK